MLNKELKMDWVPGKQSRSFGNGSRQARLENNELLCTRTFAGYVLMWISRTLTEVWVHSDLRPVCTPVWLHWSSYYLYSSPWRQKGLLWTLAQCWNNSLSVHLMKLSLTNVKSPSDNVTLLLKHRQLTSSAWLQYFHCNPESHVALVVILFHAARRA